MLTLRQRAALKRMRDEQERRQREVDRRQAELTTRWPNYSEGDPNPVKVAGADGGGARDFLGVPPPHHSPENSPHSNCDPFSSGSHQSDSHGSSYSSGDSGSYGGGGDSGGSCGGGE